MNYLLSSMIALPFIGLLFVFLSSQSEQRAEKNAKNIRCFISGCEFLLCLLLLKSFANNEIAFQFIQKYSWTELFDIYLGIDGFSCLILFAVTLIFLFISLLDLKLNMRMSKEYTVFMLWLEGVSVGLLCSLDMLLFCFFFTAIPVPIFFLLGLWGNIGINGKKNNIILFSLNVLGCGLICAGASYLVSVYNISSLEVKIINNNILSSNLFAFWSIALGIILSGFISPIQTIKSIRPVSPPSVIIALSTIPILIAVYAFIRLILPFFSLEITRFANIFQIFFITFFIYFTFFAYTNKEVRKTINGFRFASISILFLCLFSGSQYIAEGSLIFVLNYAFLITGLIIALNIINKRSQSYTLTEINGLFYSMPRFTFFFLLLIISSIFIPFSGSFTALLLLVTNIFNTSPYLSFFICIAPITIAPYMLRTYQKLICGHPSEQIEKFKDLNFTETVSLLICIIFIFALGTYPNWFASFISSSPLKIGGTV